MSIRANLTSAKTAAAVKQIGQMVNSTSGGDQLVEVISGWTQHQTIFVSCLFVLCAVVVKIVYHRNKRIAHLVPESWLVVANIQ